MRNLIKSRLGQTIALQYLAVGIGIAWGTAARRVDGYWNAGPFWPASSWRSILTFWIVPAGLAVLGLAIAASRLRRQAPPDVWTFRIVLGLILFAGFVIVAEPIQCSGGDPTNALSAVAVVLPPFFCLRRLVHRDAWLAVAGLVLFLATCVAFMFYGADSCYFGPRFLLRGVECR